MSKLADMEKELVDSRDKITVLKVQLESQSVNLSQIQDYQQSQPNLQPVQVPFSKLSLSNSRANNALPLNTTEARIQTGFYFKSRMITYLYLCKQLWNFIVFLGKFN